MDKLYQEFIEALRKVHPDLSKQLKKGASKKQIETLTNVTHALPSSYLNFLTAHNGQKEIFGSIFGNFEFLSASQVVAEWKQWNQLIAEGEFEDYDSDAPKEISSEWWSSSWIPIAGDGSGNFICIDTCPTEFGTEGQIICAYHDDPERELLSTSFEGYLRYLTESYLSGEIRPLIYAEIEDEVDPYPEDYLENYHSYMEQNQVTWKNLKDISDGEIFKFYGQVRSFDARRNRFIVSAKGLEFYARGNYEFVYPAPLCEIQVRAIHIGKHARAYRILNSKFLLEAPEYYVDPAR